MDLWQLKIFCKVVDLKSFSKAGDAVYLSQPTVSSHIKDLEEHFECKLLDRLGKEVLPTKAGELLYRYALKMITLKDETESALSVFRGVVKGKLKIGASTIPGGYLLPKLTGPFIQKYPEVSVSLKISDSENTIQQILSDHIEFGIVGTESASRNIIQERLMDDTLAILIPSGHKWNRKPEISFQELINEPFIIREEGSGTLRSIKKSFREANLSIRKLNIVAEMGNTAAVIQGIKHNMGISIIFFSS